jgi:hypothetical protein
MRSFKFQLDRKCLETLENLTFIRPLLEYADVLYDNCTQYENTELDKIQHEAARIVSGATKLVFLHELQKEVPWETVHTQRKNHKLILFNKMSHDLTPNYPSSLVLA